MNKLVFTSLVSAVAFAASAATITDVVVRQQWPWNAKVNINYVLQTEANERPDIAVELLHDDGTPEFLAARSLSGDLFAVAGGERRIVWDPAASGLTNMVAASLKFRLTARNAIGKKYMIIDLSAGSDAGAEYPITYADEIADLNTDTYKLHKLVLQRVPAGSFLMGSPDDEGGRFENEDRHRVVLTNDYYLGVFPVTTQQYKDVLGKDNGGGWAAPNRPVGHISWNLIRGGSLSAEVVWPRTTEVASDSFLGVLRSRVTGTVASGYVLDLPTEAQWEYACRAGTDAAYFDGNEWQVDENGVDANLGRLANYNPEDDGRDKGKSDGSGLSNCGWYGPNAWGFYDMLGNVYEWTLDYGVDHLSDGVEPVGGEMSTTRVLKGGSFRCWARGCRCAVRRLADPGACGSSTYGFRLALIPEVAK